MYNCVKKIKTFLQNCPIFLNNRPKFLQTLSDFSTELSKFPVMGLGMSRTPKHVMWIFPRSSPLLKASSICQSRGDYPRYNSRKLQISFSSWLVFFPAGWSLRMSKSDIRRCTCSPHFCRFTNNFQFTFWPDTRASRLSSTNNQPISTD